MATRKCKIPSVIQIIFLLNSVGVGHASELCYLKIEETGYIYPLAPNHHWLNTPPGASTPRYFWLPHAEESVLLSWREPQGGSQ